MIEKNRDNNETIKNLLESLNEYNYQSFIEYYKNPENEAWNYKDEENQNSILIIIFEKGLINLLYQIINITKQITSPQIFNNFLNSQNNQELNILHFAFYRGNLKLIKFLLDLGANHLLKGKTGLSCLHYSAMSNKLTPIYYMIKKGMIDINDKDLIGNTFYHWACFKGSEKVINFFLNDISFNINNQNNDGYTPLQLYILSRNSASMKKLIIRGADPFIRNKKGENSFDLVNEKYKNNDLTKKNLIKALENENLLKCKYFRYTSFIFFHFFYLPVVMILIEFPFISIKFFSIISVFYVIWTIFILSYIIYFLKKEPGTIKPNESDFILKLIEEDIETYNFKEDSNDNYIDISKYCIKCQIKKDKYIRHCFFCDKCIDKFDHHCTWVNKCIGKNNIKTFYLLLFLFSFNATFNLILSALALLNTEIVRFHNCLSTLFLGKMNIGKVILFLLYFFFWIFLHIGIIPLIKLYYKDYKNDNSYIFENSKIDYLIENQNEEKINLLEEE